jgi:hypothetical protein
MTAAEGPPHVRSDDGVEAASRRVSRSEAEGTPKGLARPRSDSAPEEHAGGFEGGKSGRALGGGRGRVARPRCARGEVTPGSDR